MSDCDRALDDLESSATWGYVAAGPPRVEPTALAALAFADHGRGRALVRALDWLAVAQLDDGSTPAEPASKASGWATSLSILAWKSEAIPAPPHASGLARAVEWLLVTRGETQPRSPELGHDTSIPGWPWIGGTHSWIEPTAYALLALKAAGLGRHPRAREAVRLLTDRLLQDGGCNYGNTTVLGRPLRPHLMPTGIVMLALAGEEDPDGRVDNALRYLGANLRDDTPPLSLCYGLLGRLAHGRTTAGADRWIESALAHRDRRPSGPMARSLLCIAASGAGSSLLTLARGGGLS